MCNTDVLPKWGLKSISVIIFAASKRVAGLNKGEAEYGVCYYSLTQQALCKLNTYVVV